MIPRAGQHTGMVGVTRPHGAAAQREERIRRLLLMLASAILVLLLSQLVVASSAPRITELLGWQASAAVSDVEDVLGLTWIQVVGGLSGLVAIWLITRQARRSLTTRHMMAVASGNPEQTSSLLAAWTDKAARQLESEASLAAESQPPVPTPSVPAEPNVAGALDDPALAADFLHWGQEAARAGDRHVAYRLLAQAVWLDDANEQAWLWLAATTDQPGEAIGALRRVLEINPANYSAQRGLAEVYAAYHP